MKISDITTIQWMGIIILFNTVLLGGSSQLGDLALSVGVVKAILAVATLGNGFLGGLVTMFGGPAAQTRAVAALTGDDGRPAVRINVNPNANANIAAVALDPAQKNVGTASPDVRAALADTVKAAQ